MRGTIDLMIDTTMSNWKLHTGDDPRFVDYAERLVAATAALSGQRHIVVVRIDNWFGLRWLGFPKPRFRIRSQPHGVRKVTKLSEPACFIPPFHPHRVLSEQRFELRDDGVVRGPFDPSRPLHRMYAPKLERVRIFDKTWGPGIYAWCSGNTIESDRAALMVYTHAPDETSAWYAEFRKADGWRLSQRTPIGAADWHRLLETAGITELG